jgi:hypothetical protein
MGDGTEPALLLDAFMMQNYQRRVMPTSNRKHLDDLTRSIWPTFDHAKNAVGLQELRTAIGARRAVVGRGNAR